MLAPIGDRPRAAKRCRRPQVPRRPAAAAFIAAAAVATAAAAAAAPDAADGAAAAPDGDRLAHPTRQWCRHSPPWPRTAVHQTNVNGRRVVGGRGRPQPAAGRPRRRPYLCGRHSPSASRCWPTAWPPAMWSPRTCGAPLPALPRLSSTPHPGVVSSCLHRRAVVGVVRRVGGRRGARAAPAAAWSRTPCRGAAGGGPRRGRVRGRTRPCHTRRG